MAILLGGLILPSCTRYYTITVKANNDNWGIVSGGGTFKEGETTTISASPKPNYKFVKWDDGEVTNPRSIIVTSNTTYTAIFEEPTTNPTSKVTFKGEEWVANDFGGEYYETNQEWRVVFAPVSINNFPKAECAANVTALGHFSDATTNGYDFQNNIITNVEYYESDALDDSDGNIHGDWWGKSVDIQITAFDANNLTISGIINATMFNAIEAFVEGVGFNNATTTEMTIEMDRITLIPSEQTGKEKIVISKNNDAIALWHRRRPQPRI